MTRILSTNVERRILHFAKKRELYIMSEEDGRKLKLPRNKFKIVFENGVCNIWKR